MHDPRRAAVSALRAWSKGRDYADSLVERHAQRQQLSKQDRALLNAIVLGVIRHRRLLDHWIAKLRKGRLDHETRDILRVGLCQLLILELPDHAAVFETVELGRSPVRGLLNAVLRRATKQRKDLIADRDAAPPPIRHSHPDWLFKRWAAAFGEPAAICLMEWNNDPAPTYARRNPLATTPAGHPSLQPLADHPDFLQIDGPPPTDLLASGAIYIQDPSTRHCVELLDPKPGERILDACAAPGGKAFLIAATRGSAEGLLCTDSNEKRLPRLRQNLDRLHCSEAAIAPHDWTTAAPPDWHAAFDAILLDVPCSNTGVMRRRVDARWRLQPDDLGQLAALQRTIAENALPCLKPGGRLVYSTCSIDDQENQQQVDHILSAHPDLSLTDTRQVLPHRDRFDGAFSAAFKL
jgi:16S rRNA (cytosine967-C5)-methyltransferase